MKSFKELIGGLEEARLFASYQDAAAAAAPGQKPKLDPASNKYILVREEAEAIEEATVSKKDYSWGKMMTVHHGKDTSYPLHPEHQKIVKNLRPSGEHSKAMYKDETGKQVHVTREGDKVHFVSHKTSGSKKTTVDYKHFDEQAPVAPVPDKKYIKGTPEHKAYKATKKPINGMPTNKMSCEEVEQLEEANHREFASQGKMHPDMAKHMTVGQEMDYYEPKTGDKVSGKVMHKSDKEVHIKQTHDSYDPKKKGTVHKFKVSSTLDEQSDAELDQMIFEVLSKDASSAEWIHDFIHSDDPKFAGKSKEKRKQMALAAYYSKQRNEEVQKADIPAYLRKAKGDKPLELKDLKRKDTLSSAENLAKNRGVKEQQEGTMKSYKEFVTEIKMSDLPSRSVKGTSYGAQYHDPEGDDDADNKKPAKAADAPKRGRGRPAGSTSGARQQGSAKQGKTGGVDYTGYKVHLPNTNK